MWQNKAKQTKQNKTKQNSKLMINSIDGISSERVWSNNIDHINIYCNDDYYKQHWMNSKERTNK